MSLGNIFHANHGFFSNKLPLIWINKKICLSFTVWWLSPVPQWIHKSVSLSNLQIILTRNKKKQYKLSFLHDFSGPGVCTPVWHILMLTYSCLILRSLSWATVKFAFSLLLFRVWILVGKKAVILHEVQEQLLNLFELATKYDLRCQCRSLLLL